MKKTTNCLFVSVCSKKRSSWLVYYCYKVWCQKCPWPQCRSHRGPAQVCWGWLVSFTSDSRISCLLSVSMKLWPVNFLQAGKILQLFSILDSVWQWEWAADRDMAFWKTRKTRPHWPVDGMCGSSWECVSSILTKLYSQISKKRFSKMLPVYEEEWGRS